MVRFRMFGAVEAVETYSKLIGGVYTVDEIDGLYGEVTSDNFLEDAAQPGSSATGNILPQTVDIEIEVDGEVIERVNRIGEIVVEMDYDNTTQGASVRLPILPSGSLYGSPEGCVGPSIGKSPINVYGIYVDAAENEEYRVPLITDGIVDTMPRESGEDGIYEDIVILDRMARFTEKKITRQFPPGHGLRRGRVCARVFEDLEFPDFSFEDGETMMKELQLVDATPIEPLKDLLETENRRLFCNGEGTAINPRVGRVRSDESPRFIFTERNFVRASVVRLEPQQNVITLVIANGTQQNVTEQGPCVERVENEVHYSYQTEFSPKEAPYRQKTDGTYDVLDPTPAIPGETLVSKVEIFRRFLCEELIEEKVSTYRMLRRETVRHQWKYNAVDDENQWHALLCYTDDNTENDSVGSGVGAGPAYIDRRESLQLAEISHTFYYFLHNDFIFRGGSLTWEEAVHTPHMTPLMAANIAAGIGTADEYFGQAQGAVTYYSRVGHIRGYIKTRINLQDTWEDVEPPIDTMLWGDGTAYRPYNGTLQSFLTEEGTSVPTNVDHLIPWGISSTGYEGTKLQQLQTEDEVVVGWRAPRGNFFYYGDNDSRSEAVESFRTLDLYKTTYSQTGDTHSEIVVHTDTITGIVKTEVQSGLPGSLPAIERLDFVDPEPSIYEAGELTAIDEDTGELIPGLDKQAKRRETTQITVTVPFDNFLSCHLPREVVVDFQWAENAEEIRKMAEALAQESAAMPFFATLPANFLIRPADLIRVTYRPLELEDAEIRVKRVRHTRSVDAPLLTEIEGRYYAF